jgi:phage FluMu protein Com
MEDLIFTPLKVRCPKCAEFSMVSIESLDANEEVICPRCNFVYFTDIDADKLLKLIKVVEKSEIVPNNVV